MFDDQTVLVTGGTGSFGHEVVKSLLETNAREIRLFSRDEDKQYHMKNLYARYERLRFMIGDVRDLRSVRRAVRGANVVLHAAALKHVPSCEYFPAEAVKTNINGAQNVIEACIEENVARVVAISTDKAVEPINVMGMTKAVQEKLLIGANYRRDGFETKFSVVRYGNVAGSRGSVIPLFRQCIESNKKLPITSSEMTRFVLGLPAAVQLVFKAAQEAVGGEIFVMRVPAHSVVELARVLLRRAGRPEDYYEIVGVRPGEKLHETLVSPVEATRTVELGEYYVILPEITTPAVGEHYAKHRRVAFERYASNSGPLLADRDLEAVLDEAERKKDLL